MAKHNHLHWKKKFWKYTTQLTLREFGNILLTPLIKWSLVSSSDFNVGHEKEKQLGLKHMNFISKC